jgi:1,4-alpha-glucan branching enzyme
MAKKSIEFQFLTGLKRQIFRNPRLVGTWDGNGRYSDQWSQSAMQEVTGEDGCPVFQGSVPLDLADSGKTFKWGVILDGPSGANFWGIPTEVHDVNSTERHRDFQIAPGDGVQTERYYFTHCRRFGANKRFSSAGGPPRLVFAAWASSAKAVDVVFGTSSGYINDHDGGIDPVKPVVSLSKSGGVWQGNAPGNFSDYMSLPYMYRIKNAQDNIVYRTDIFSRSQMGKGAIDPSKSAWPGIADTLDGAVSCSVVIDPDVIRKTFESTPPGSQPDLIPAENFWANEFTPGLPVPSRIEDLNIYELHVGSLGFGNAGAGDLADAIEFLSHLVELGINAVEMLPMAEFGRTASWGYGSSHHFCIESSAGGRDKYRHFVRECHRRGIAVIQDVVYNHYEDGHVDRAEKFYDSTAPEEDIYYWYEGRTSDYSFPDGGYLNNGSSGRTPRFWEENVRQQFISGAAFLMEEMHVDGFRVDLTQAIHRDNTLNATGWGVTSANIFGQKFLRQWSRTLHMIRPTAMLIAEDHTGWPAVVQSPDQGGLGFDSKWQVRFYHSLIGDSDMAGGQPRLLKQAGVGGNEPLGMDAFSGTLYDTRSKQVVFNESHDEAGNAPGTARTIVVAVNWAPLFGATRVAVEARCRLCFGLSLLSAGTPMFFMGEEIGAQRRYTYNNFIANREDILGERTGNGKLLFRFYQDLIALRRRLPGIRTHNIDILHQSNDNRVIAFKRWIGAEQLIILASFNNAAFSDGYIIQKDLVGIPDGGWTEVFNSDAVVYGGQNVGNFGATIPSADGRLAAKIPASGFVVFVKQ